MVQLAFFLPPTVPWSSIYDRITIRYILLLVSRNQDLLFVPATNSAVCCRSEFAVERYGGASHVGWLVAGWHTTAAARYIINLKNMDPISQVLDTERGTDERPRLDFRLLIEFIAFKSAGLYREYLLLCRFLAGYEY